MTAAGRLFRSLFLKTIFFTTVIGTKFPAKFFKIILSSLQFQAANRAFFLEKIKHKFMLL
ncbi:MAG: hypothetical protein A3J65_00535 [Candidatus Buchananbacteria bacterium RIFCSPHIGHO2_02_FULL_45_11b]|uniref:Uncharacterized protein n=4 Tax=Candidatus Buchananiibacteriota TaxID=1817903 RepID=A0A1G1YBU1_9BACT|nr:MAG: hypothetical protein A2663_01070 [Candidatus Buchananbacteria bacterium RIFCSPHIGHO2_01_FULL_46_12]OGY49815.1 MAG: hypothetical protein A3J65_00535 [Candidatus Buchananbacteria bacterium RIFCSPHIGHO2_02_FULL_45_11b]OGY53597.1 MAG: hypothetical protein A3B15_03425 [Candidatus Buchananbacteria bacterium RIFCSPLOWO2_01_FULL_45_31]OGY57352.1 MAG: hypothetical protein A3H67_04405 [Candidatus Buchananbacteria bacterium RIFCSPLOWO2_02_FULL_46_11b]